MRILVILLSLLMSLPTLAAWRLNNSESQLSFISIKKANVAEVHRFTRLSGNIAEHSPINLIIDLSSANTGIAVRDQRLGKFLFETNLYPQAKFVVNLGDKVLSNVAVGENNIIEITGKLSLHGIEQTITTTVMLARISQHKLIVTSMQPVIIHAKAFNLAKGVEKLQALAKLPSISKAVPVSFVLTFVDKS